MEQIELMTKKFRINLKHLRNANGFSQINVAEELKISTRGYQRIESGDSQPTLDLILKLAHILRVDFSDLFSYSSKDDSFVEIPTESVGDLLHGQEFLNLLNHFDKVYFNKKNALKKSILDTIAEDKRFILSDLPLYISDLVNVITNQPSAKILTRKPGIKMNAGVKWKEQKASISIINRIYGREEIFFKSTHIYQVGQRNLEVVFCNFYKSFSNGENFLIGIILDSKEL